MLDLSEIRAVTDKATPGPWVLEGCGYIRSRPTPDAAIEIPDELTICMVKRYKNAPFIASARQWVPDLCDEVEADREKINELEKTLEKACEYLADNNASRIDWKEYFSKRAREEMENGK